jgi:tetratricopeptide (TPR) repeat protein
MVYKKKISIIMTSKMLLMIALIFGGLVANAQGTEDKKAEECINKWGTDSVETQKHLSMFNQYYQEKKYVEAFPYWYYLFVNAPCVQKRVTFNGPYIIKKALRDERYKPRFAGLVDTLFLVHQKRIEFFGQEGYVKGKWADDMAKLTPKRRAEALDMFHESIGLEGVKTRYGVPKHYVYAALKQYKRGKLSVDSLLLILDEVSPIIDENIATYTADGVSAKDSIKGTKWVATQESIINMLKPYLDCDKLVELRQPAYEDNKENAAWLKSTIKLMGKGGCEANEFYLMSSEQLFKLEPSTEAALALAKAFSRGGDDVKASKYYNKAADLAPTDAEKYGIYIKLAKTSKNNKQYSKVRDYARKALAINANSGEAYMLIGDAYKSSATSCGTGDLGSAGVYLAAADKYIRAKSVDPSVAEDANKKIATCTARFPDKETAFFKGVNNGDSYSVGCWIGETTKVRTIGG